MKQNDDNDRVATVPALRPRIAALGSADERATWADRLAVASSRVDWFESLANLVVELRSGRFHALFIPADVAAVRGLLHLSEAVPVVVASANLWSTLGDARYKGAALVGPTDDLLVAIQHAIKRHRDGAAK